MMRAANVCLVAVTALGAAFVGTFAAGFAGGLLHSGALINLLSMPAILVAAHFAGRWISRRDNPPNRPELITGAGLYTVLSLLGVFGAAGAGLWLVTFVAAALAGFVLVRAARLSVASVEAGRSQTGLRPSTQSGNVFGG